MSTTVSPALEELEAAVGSEALLTSDEQLREFRDPLGHATWDDDTASLDHGVTYMPYMRFRETIKDALDPNGVLAPGKSGIWPKAMR